MSVKINFAVRAVAAAALSLIAAGAIGQSTATPPHSRTGQSDPHPVYAVRIRFLGAAVAPADKPGDKAT